MNSTLVRTASPPRELQFGAFFYGRLLENRLHRICEIPAVIECGHELHHNSPCPRAFVFACAVCSCSFYRKSRLFTVQSRARIFIFGHSWSLFNISLSHSVFVCNRSTGFLLSHSLIRPVSVCQSFALVVLKFLISMSRGLYADQTRQT